MSDVKKIRDRGRGTMETGRFRFFSAPEVAGKTTCNSSCFQKSLQKESLVLCNLQGPIAPRWARREQRGEDRMQDFGLELVGSQRSPVPNPPRHHIYVSVQQECRSHKAPDPLVGTKTTLLVMQPSYHRLWGAPICSLLISEQTDQGLHSN